MRIGVMASGKALEALDALLEAYRARYELCITETGGEVPGEERLAQVAEGQDALLVLGDRRRAPRTVLPGPVLQRGDGALIPVGWLPDGDPSQLRCFAAAAALVHRRAEGHSTSVAVLGQWNPRYLNLADRIERLLREGSRVDPVLRWTSDRLHRDDLICGLGTGPGAAIYVGHGRPVGWVGYRGTRAHHFFPYHGKPMGALFSLCCETASRKRTGLSFSEAVPLMGVAAAAFGAVGPTLFTDNARWALGICRAITRGVTTVGGLVIDALPLSPQAVRSYRILGDPTAPIVAEPSAPAKALVWSGSQ